MVEKEIEILKAVLKEGLTSKKGNKYNVLVITYKNGKSKNILMSDADIFNACREN